MNKILITIVIVIVAAVGWYLASPLFITTEVDEAFPEVEVLPTDEELARMTDEELSEIEDEVMKMTRELPDTKMTEVMPTMASEPELLAEGVFVGADSFHEGRGNAHIFRLSDESRILRLENFFVTNGPDLRVLLAEHENPTSRGDVQKGYIELGKLKGNVGNQNYEISGEVDLSQYKSVVIYCKPFHVLFSTARLEK